jgi:predicted nucleic acid-binding protein
MILVDSNVPMYLVGAHHPHKVDAQRVLERHQVATILSFDRGFDSYPGIERLS